MLRNLAATQRVCTRRCFSSTSNFLASTSYSHPSNLTDFGAYTRQNQHDKVVIDESLAKKSALVNSLHSRLSLGKDFNHSTLARALVCDSAQTKFADNHGMATFGKRLVAFYVREYFTVKFPRLPPSIVRHLLELYSSPLALSRVAKAMGIEEDARPPYARYLADESDEQLLGKLLYSNKEVVAEEGVVEVMDHTNRTDQNLAMAQFVRSLVAGVYAHNGGLESAGEFVRNYIIKRNRIDVATLLSFEQPTRELAVLCAREGLESPVSRLMVETGRFSKAPVYVVGVFSGDKKLGEGQGSSLKEARTRAAVHALKAWYLYSPVNSTLPSQGGHNQHLDSGVVVM